MIYLHVLEKGGVRLYGVFFLSLTNKKKLNILTQIEYTEHSFWKPNVNLTTLFSLRKQHVTPVIKCSSMLT